MSDQASDTTGSGASGGFPFSPVTRPARPPPEYDRPAGSPQPAAENPRSKGYSPARDAREAAPEPAERKIKLGESEFLEKDVLSAVAERAEQQVRKNLLPQSPDGYELKLPPNFEAPVGVNFEWDPADPLLKSARELAHRRGIDQEVFSEFLGAYAANKLTEHSHAEAMRQVHMKALGSRGVARIDGLATFLTAHAGKDGAALADFVRRFPNATFVSALERIAHAFSSQGDAGFSQSGRAAPEPQPLPSMSKGFSYAQVRSAQDQQLGQQVRLKDTRK